MSAPWHQAPWLGRLQGRWATGRQHWRQAREHTTVALQQAWDDTPEWARTPRALLGLAAFVALALLASIALVVHSEVRLSEARQAAELARAGTPTQAEPDTAVASAER